MSHNISISSSLTKEEKYKSLIPQIQSLVSDEKDMIANLANICAALKYNLDNIFWVGFYFVKVKELVVGPYQGPIACNRIKIPDGVCGMAVKDSRTIIAEDVNTFPGHITCSPDSKSEIVVPVFKDNQVYAVLDIDSDKYSNFDNIDKIYLEELSALISELI